MVLVCIALSIILKLAIRIKCIFVRPLIRLSEKVYYLLTVKILKILGRFTAIFTSFCGPGLNYTFKSTEMRTQATENPLLFGIAVISNASV